MRWGLLLLLLVPVVHAAVIDTAVTTADMDTGWVDITTTYSIVGDNSEDLDIILPSDSIKINADMDGEHMACMFETSNVTTVRCGTVEEGIHNFTISYRTSQPIADVERLMFRYTETLPFRTAEHTFILKLPVGYVVASEQGKDPAFFINPAPTDVLSDGQRILLSWKNRDVSKFSVSAVAQSVRSFGWIYTLGGFVLAAVAGAGTTWYVLHRRKKKNEKDARKEAKQSQKETRKELVPQFIENERKVVDILTRAENHEVWQKLLLAETKFSKAKLSRIIKNLEQRGVITKTVYGNTNKISLKKR